MRIVRNTAIESISLAEAHGVTVFLPPRYRPSHRFPVLFCADGQSVGEFAERLHREMLGNSIPEVIVIGIHSYSHVRHQEYILGANRDRFEAHERFFANEVYNWTASEFSIGTSRETCGVFGFSNGAAFALTLALRHRSKFGLAIAFSVPSGVNHFADSEYAIRPIARHYLAAGTREKPIRKATRRLADVFTTNAVDHLYAERHAGHEFSFWDAELPKAIRWGFSLRHEA